MRGLHERTGYQTSHKARTLLQEDSNSAHTASPHAAVRVGGGGDEENEPEKTRERP